MATQTIRTRCGADGEARDIAAAAVRVVMCPTGYLLTFRCPHCGEQTTREASIEEAAMLRANGIRFVRLHGDREMGDPQRIRLLPRMDGEWLADEVIALGAAPDALVGKLPIGFVMETVARRRSAARLRRGR